MNKHPYRIVLADDHTIVRQGLKRMLEGMGDLMVIGEASDGNQLLGLLKTLKADLIILDISMPNLPGIEATCELKKIFPNAKVLVLTMYKDKELLHHAISSGADGYVLKEDSDRELYSAIQKIRQGKIYISPRLSDGFRNHLIQRRRGMFPHTLGRLTRREKEILGLIAQGKSCREIANLLFISIRTVQNHRFNIRSKLGIKNTADLIRYAVHHGYAS